MNSYVYIGARAREREEMSFCRDSIDFVPEIQLLCSRQRWRIFSADKKNSISSIALRNRNRMFVVEISRRSKVKSRETKTAFRLRIEDNGISIPLNLTFNRQKIQFSLLFLNGPASLFVSQFLAQVRSFRIATRFHFRLPCQLFNARSLEYLDIESVDRISRINCPGE